MTSPYYQDYEWTHWLFPLTFPPSLYNADSSFEPYDPNSPLLLHRLSDAPVIGLYHTLPSWYAVAHGIQHRKRPALFTVTGQIVPDDLTFNSFQANPQPNSQTITALSFWIEARPDPASRREWQGVLTGLQSLMHLVGQPVDTSNFFVTSSGSIRIRVHGGYRRANGRVGYPLLDIDGERIVLSEREMIPQHSGVRVVFRVECEHQAEMLSMSAPLVYLALL